MILVYFGMLRIIVIHQCRALAKCNDLLRHDEKAREPTLAHLLAAMRHPEMPEAIGVLRDVERPTQNELMAKGDGPDKAPADADRDLEELLRGPDSWVVT